jgi:hypothetical protein
MQKFQSRWYLILEFVTQIKDIKVARVETAKDWGREISLGTVLSLFAILTGNCTSPFTSEGVSGHRV